MTKIVIIGSDGMLGSAFVKVLSQRKQEIIALTIKDIDITQLQSVNHLKDYEFDIIINCAAFTAVDQAETDQSMAYSVNSLGVKNLAIFASENNKKLVHFSTDYVFAGDKKLYIESDSTGPISIYGKSKLEGEQEIQRILDINQYLILRTAWLYGPNGKNFVKTMLNLAQTRNEINVVGDQYGAPTYSFDLVAWTLALVDMGSCGIYHAVNSGSSSWCLFAKRIFQMQKQKVQVNCISTEEYPTPASRPKYSILCNKKLEKVLSYKIRKWEEALSEYLISINI